MSKTTRSQRGLSGHGHATTAGDDGAPGRRTLTQQVSRRAGPAADEERDDEDAVAMVEAAEGEGDADGGCDDGCTHEGHAHARHSGEPIEGGCDDDCSDPTHGHGGHAARSGGGDAGPAREVADHDEIQAAIDRTAAKRKPRGERPDGGGDETASDAAADPGDPVPDGGGDALGAHRAALGRLLEDDLDPDVGHAVTAANPPGFPQQLKLGRATFRVGAPPKLEVSTTKRGTDHVATVKQTTIPALTSSAVAAPAGSYNRGRQPFRINGKPKQYKITLVISDAIHREIVRGEQEHLDDYQRAWDLSYKRAGNAVNAQAGTEFTGRTKNAAIKAAKDAVKATLPDYLKNPAKWGARMTQLAAMSQKYRDAKNTHTWLPISPVPDADIDHDAKTATMRYLSNTLLGEASTSVVDPAKLK
jgi:hypothetical protein